MVLGTEPEGDDSDEERPGRLLEGGDGAVGLGKRGLEMCEDLCGGRPTGRCGRHIGRPQGRWTATQQRRADRTLSALKPTPESPKGSVAAGTVGRADGGGDAAGDDALKERPQGASSQAQPPDFAGEPHADGASAAAPAMAVAAEDAPGADGSPGAAVIEAGENAVSDERADRTAMRARREFEPFDDRGPLGVVLAEPSFVAHERAPAAELHRAYRRSGGREKRRGPMNLIRWKSGVVRQGQAAEPDRAVYRIPAA